MATPGLPSYFNQFNILGAGTAGSPYRVTGSAPSAYDQGLSQLQASLSQIPKSQPKQSAPQTTQYGGAGTGTQNQYAQIAQIPGYNLNPVKPLPGGRGGSPTLTSQLYGVLQNLSGGAYGGMGGRAGGIISTDVLNDFNKYFREVTKGPLAGGGGGPMGENPAVLEKYHELTGVPLEDIQASTDPNWYGWKQLYPQAQAAAPPAYTGSGYGMNPTYQSPAGWVGPSGPTNSAQAYVNNLQQQSFNPVYGAAKHVSYYG